jgi:hypothetical protein
MQTMTTKPLARTFLCAAALAFAADLCPAQDACVGDCDANGTIAVSELLQGVRISLGHAAAASCPALDADGGGSVSIDELIAAVAGAMNGCRRQRLAFVLGSDFFTGGFGTFPLDDPADVTRVDRGRLVHEDSVARTFGGRVYVVNRLFADNVERLDPARGFVTEAQCSTGPGSNPHDIAFVDEHKAYVTLFERAELLIVDPSVADCRDFVRGTIDLSAYADADGIPDMDQMVIVGNRLYVSLQRLDINTILRLPAERGAIAVVDVDTDEPVGLIELSGENPFAATKGLTVSGGAIVVAEAGRFGVFDGGIERVDLGSGRALGFAATEEDLGGDVTDFVLVSARLAYAIVSRPDFGTALVAFDPRDGTLLRTVTEADGFDLFDIELDDRGELFLADRTRRTPGVRIFRAADGKELTDVPIDVGLPPFEIVFLD